MIKGWVELLVWGADCLVFIHNSTSRHSFDGFKVFIEIIPESLHGLFCVCTESSVVVWFLNWPMLFGCLHDTSMLLSANNLACCIHTWWLFSFPVCWSVLLSNTGFRNILTQKWKIYEKRPKMNCLLRLSIWEAFYKEIPGNEQHSSSHADTPIVRVV